MLVSYKQNGFLIHELKNKKILKKLRRRFISIFNETGNKLETKSDCSWPVLK